MNQNIIYQNLPDLIAKAVAHYWTTRTVQSKKQEQSGRADQGLRSAVTSGAQMDGFIDLFTELVTSIGISNRFIFRKKAIELPGFSPLDINLEFLHSKGWSINTDRVRFHTEMKMELPQEHPMAQILGILKPHLLLRKIDKEEDYFISIQVMIDGNIQILCNDSDKASEYLRGVFLGFPPSFKEPEDISQGSQWSDDETTFAMFCGMLHGAYGWDPSHDLPPFLEESIHEAQKSLEIGNYKSCVVMCRRGIEALLKFAYKRLLRQEPLDKNKRTLMLNELIKGFKGKGKIPDHLLYVADSLRLLGNVPGAHAAEIKDYQFTRYDAEFAIASMLYFGEQYFTKIDSEVTSYFTVSIDLSEQ
ncbi:MAG TPA: PaeR7I family type II restriction endonuclease [Syntrophales bacterium]|nr:PaeR7I family type II restriction endonuclease [Syntrophales bacterium]